MTLAVPIDRVRIEVHFMSPPSRGMSGKTAAQRRTRIIGGAGLRDLWSFVAQQVFAFVAGPHDGDMAWLVVVMIAICSHDQLAAIGAALRFDRIGHWQPS